MMLVKSQIKTKLLFRQRVYDIDENEANDLNCYSTSQNGHKSYIMQFFSIRYKNVGASFTSRKLLTAKQLKTQRDKSAPLDGHDANLDRQDGLKEAPLHYAVSIGVAIEYLERRRQA